MKHKQAQTKAEPTQMNLSKCQQAQAKAKQVQPGSGDKHNQAGTSTTKRTQMGGDKQGPANRRRQA